MGNVVTPCTRKAPGFRREPMGTSQTCSMRYDRDEWAILITEGNVDDQCFAGWAEVNQQYPTASRSRHLPHRGE